MSIEIIAFVFGCVLVLIGIIGGGLEIKEIKIPTIRGATRIVAIIDGCRPHGSTVDLTPFSLDPIFTLSLFSFFHLTHIVTGLNILETNYNRYICRFYVRIYHNNSLYILSFEKRRTNTSSNTLNLKNCSRY